MGEVGLKGDTVRVVILGAGLGTLLRRVAHTLHKHCATVEIVAIEGEPLLAAALKASLDKEPAIGSDGGRVEVIAADPRSVVLREGFRADVALLDLFSGFGDDEMAPELASRLPLLLKPAAPVIPSAATVYVFPVLAEKLRVAAAASHGPDSLKDNQYRGSAFDRWFSASPSSAQPLAEAQRLWTVDFGLCTSTLAICQPLTWTLQPMGSARRRGAWNLRRRPPGASARGSWASWSTPSGRSPPPPPPTSSPSPASSRAPSSASPSTHSSSPSPYTPLSLFQSKILNLASELKCPLELGAQSESSFASGLKLPSAKPRGFWPSTEVLPMEPNPIQVHFTRISSEDKVKFLMFHRSR